MSNVEVMYSVYFKKDRAQRLHPSAFHIPTSAFVKCSFIRAPPLAKKTASLIEKETNEHRTSNVQHRIMYAVNLKKPVQDYFARLATKAKSEFTLRNSAIRLF
jgi:hypothetical protein